MAPHSRRTQPCVAVEYRGGRLMPPNGHGLQRPGHRTLAGLADLRSMPEAVAPARSPGPLQGLVGRRLAPGRHRGMKSSMRRPKGVRGFRMLEPTSEASWRGLECAF